MKIVGARLGHEPDLRRAHAGAFGALRGRRHRDLFDRIESRRHDGEERRRWLRLVLSWMLTPSSVMLMVPCGRPLTIESRWPPAVFVPGRNTTKSNALRLESGRLATSRVSSVVVTVADCVCTSSAVLCTMTCSVSAAELQRGADARGHARVDHHVVEEHGLESGERDRHRVSAGDKGRHRKHALSTGDGAERFPRRLILDHDSPRPGSLRRPHQRPRPKLTPSTIPGHRLRSSKVKATPLTPSSSFAGPSHTPAHPKRHRRQRTQRRSHSRAS